MRRLRAFGRFDSTQAFPGDFVFVEDKHSEALFLGQIRVLDPNKRVAHVRLPTEVNNMFSCCTAQGTSDIPEVVIKFADLLNPGATPEGPRSTVTGVECFGQLGSTFRGEPWSFGCSTRVDDACLELGQYTEVAGGTNHFPKSSATKGTQAARGGTHVGVPMKETLVCVGVITFGKATEVRYLCFVLSHLGCCYYSLT